MARKSFRSKRFFFEERDIGHCERARRVVVPLSVRLKERDLLYLSAAHEICGRLVAEGVGEREFHVPRQRGLGKVVHHERKGEFRPRHIIGGEREIVPEPRLFRRGSRLGDAADYNGAPVLHERLRRPVLGGRAVHAVADVLRFPHAPQLAHNGFYERIVTAAALVEFIETFKCDPRVRQPLRRGMRPRAHDYPVRRPRRREPARRNVAPLCAQSDDRDHTVSPFSVRLIFS